jgi:hypothetical protein
MREDWFFKRAMSAETHLLSGKEVRDLIPDMLAYGTDLRQVIRVMCLESLLNGNFYEYPQYVNMLHFNYGIQIVPLLIRLQEVGLLVPKNGFKWADFVKTFQLYVPEWERMDDQAAASYLGYAPLSARYVQKIVNGEGWSLRDPLSNIGQSMYVEGPKGVTKMGAFLVCFIGGCTHSELNSLRRSAQ